MHLVLRPLRPIRADEAKLWPCLAPHDTGFCPAKLFAFALSTEGRRLVWLFEHASSQRCGEANIASPKAKVGEHTPMHTEIEGMRTNTLAAAPPLAGSTDSRAS